MTAGLRLRGAAGVRVAAVADPVGVPGVDVDGVAGEDEAAADRAAVGRAGSVDARDCVHPQASAAAVSAMSAFRMWPSTAVCRDPGAAAGFIA
jgi:hypothetical protein